MSKAYVEGRSDPTLTFTVIEEDQSSIQKWLAETVYPAVIAAQKEKLSDSLKGSQLAVAEACWTAGHPYEGVCGGCLSYTFAPSTISGRDGPVTVRYRGFYDKVYEFTTDYAF